MSGRRWRGAVAGAGGAVAGLRHFGVSGGCSMEAMSSTYAGECRDGTVQFWSVTMKMAPLRAAGRSARDLQKLRVFGGLGRVRLGR